MLVVWLGVDWNSVKHNKSTQVNFTRKYHENKTHFDPLIGLPWSHYHSATTPVNHPEQHEASNAINHNQQ